MLARLTAALRRMGLKSRQGHKYSDIEELQRKLEAHSLLQTELDKLRDSVDGLVKFQQTTHTHAQALAVELNVQKSEVSSLREELNLVGSALKRVDPARLDRMELLVAEHPRLHSATASKIEFGSPVVSIVMPTWNRAAIIGAAIRSAKAQTFTDWELVIVDDGSVDDTQAVVRSFALDRRIRYVSQEHLGQSAARNHAIRLARGELVAYLDSDNLWYPEYLSVAVALFCDRPEVNCAYGFIVNGKDKPQLFSTPFDRLQLSKNNFIPMSTFIHRRNMVDLFGGFDETLGRYEDWDLVLRYTAHAAPYRLAVRAARRRTMDSIRVSDTRPKDEDFSRVRARALL